MKTEQGGGVAVCIQDIPEDDDNGVSEKVDRLKACNDEVRDLKNAKRMHEEKAKEAAAELKEKTAERDRLIIDLSNVAPDQPFSSPEARVALLLNGDGKWHGWDKTGAPSMEELKANVDKAASVLHSVGKMNSFTSTDMMAILSASGHHGILPLGTCGDSKVAAKYIAKSAHRIWDAAWRRSRCQRLDTAESEFSLPVEFRDKVGSLGKGPAWDFNRGKRALLETLAKSRSRGEVKHIARKTLDWMKVLDV